VAGDKEEPAAAGTIAFVPAGAARGIKATTRFVAVTVVTPLPTDADHAGVMAGLRKGDWRG
jgi:quercetin dioxygenase-like cupin family protein